MSNLLILVKILTALYQVKKLNDKTLLDELMDVLKTVPVSSSDVFVQDKKIEDDIRSTIEWVLEQPNDEPIIKSLLMQRVSDFTRNAPELKESVEYGLEDFDGDKDEERIRRIIYKHISEIRQHYESDKFNRSFKKLIKEFHFGEMKHAKKEDYIKLMDLIQEGINKQSGENQTEIIGTLNSESPEGFNAVIEQAKKEASAEGILKLGIQGLNIGLEPDGGMRRGKAYLFEALTNRGKSLTMGHIIASVGLYNKPQLRNPSKMATIVLDSAEDTLDVILMRMYKLFMTVNYGEAGNFLEDSPEKIIGTIVEGFKKNGWCLIINYIEPNKDNFLKLCERIRKLEMRGHEIIFYGYDYLGMMELEGISGDSKSDKLQLLARKTRSFMISRGICFATPFQLNPDAKRILRESDDESEIYFAREVSGKSMTEGSTKLTNEFDVVITVHVAKTNVKNYMTFAIGKQRGEGCDPKHRFCIYDLHPTLGLIHDINTKPMFRRSINQSFNPNGEVTDDWDEIDKMVA